MPLFSNVKINIYEQARTSGYQRTDGLNVVYERITATLIQSPGFGFTEDGEQEFRFLLDSADVPLLTSMKGDKYRIVLVNENETGYINLFHGGVPIAVQPGAFSCYEPLLENKTMRESEYFISFAIQDLRTFPLSQVIVQTIRGKTT